MTGNASSRLDWVDVAKAIGIVLVVYGHVARGAQVAGVGLPSEIFLLVDGFIYSFHMPLFFFLSGLFFAPSYAKQGPAGLLGSKIDTILYPYVVWSLIQGGIEVVFQEYKNTGTSFVDMASLLWHPRAQFWFLYVLFLLFCGCVFFRLIWKSQWILPTLFVGGALYFAPSTGIYVFDLLNANLVFFVFGAGYAMFDIRKWMGLRGVSYVAIVVAFVAQWGAHQGLDFVWHQRGWLSLAVACLMILAVIAVSMLAASAAPKMMVDLGRNSMPIYLMHILFASSFRVALHRLLGVVDPAAHLVAGTLVGLLGPLYAYRYMQARGWIYLFSAPISDQVRGYVSRSFSRQK